MKAPRSSRRDNRASENLNGGNKLSGACAGGGPIL